jgi:hypothetical protein
MEVYPRLRWPVDALLPKVVQTCLSRLEAAPTGWVLLMLSVGEALASMSNTEGS